MGVRFQFCMVLISLVVNVPDSAAWGPQGHSVIGLIADGHLKPEVKELIAKKFNINEKKKAPGITPILKKGSGLITLKGIARMEPVLRRKFMNFRVSCVLPLYGKGRRMR